MGNGGWLRDSHRYRKNRMVMCVNIDSSLDNNKVRGQGVWLG